MFPRFTGVLHSPQARKTIRDSCIVERTEVDGWNCGEMIHWSQGCTEVELISG